MSPSSEIGAFGRPRAMCCTAARAISPCAERNTHRPTFNDVSRWFWTHTTIQTVQDLKRARLLRNHVGSAWALLPAETDHCTSRDLAGACMHARNERRTRRGRGSVVTGYYRRMMGSKRLCQPHSLCYGDAPMCRSCHLAPKPGRKVARAVRCCTADDVREVGAR